ncbi:MAG: hypothetical protein J0H40_17065 [Rhizobiales bacterium]|nr:hypothetical protein [Hyphomicrobiales bacterium]
MAGDHTNFNQGAFTAGAVTGSATIAGAMVAGFRNVAHARRERAVVNAISGRDALIGSLQRRIDKQRDELARRDAVISEQAFTIRELQIRLQMSNLLRQKGR